MSLQSHDRAIVSELFNENNVDTLRSSIVYDDAGRVIKLSLYDADSDGSSIFEFPAHFDQLTQLRELYMYASLAYFPMSICRLPNLRAFVLSEQRPVCEFPSEFAQLRSLRYLGLGENAWGDYLPPALWQFPQLRVLDLSWNALTRLPAEIGQLTQLRFLYLQGNHIGWLPDEITQLTVLEELGMWQHGLESSPQAIAQLHKLYEQAPALRCRIRSGDYEPCICCGYLTIKEAYDICPVCWWEADGTQGSSPSSPTGANTGCLIEARLNFARTGVAKDRLLDKARSPLPAEIPDEENRMPHMDFGRDCI
jgi:hypothetical protein